MFLLRGLWGFGVREDWREGEGVEGVVDEGEEEGVERERMRGWVSILWLGVVVVVCVVLRWVEVCEVVRLCCCSVEGLRFEVRGVVVLYFFVSRSISKITTALRISRKTGRFV